MGPLPKKDTAKHWKLFLPFHCNKKENELKMEELHKREQVLSCIGKYAAYVRQLEKHCLAENTQNWSLMALVFVIWS